LIKGSHHKTVVVLPLDLHRYAVVVVVVVVVVVAVVVVVMVKKDHSSTDDAVIYFLLLLLLLVLFPPFIILRFILLLLLLQDFTTFISMIEKQTTIDFLLELLRTHGKYLTLPTATKLLNQ